MPLLMHAAPSPVAALLRSSSDQSARSATALVNAESRTRGEGPHARTALGTWPCRRPASCPFDTFLGIPTQEHSRGALRPQTASLTFAFPNPSPLSSSQLTASSSQSVARTHSPRTLVSHLSLSNGNVMMCQVSSAQAGTDLPNLVLYRQAGRASAK